MCPAIWRSAGMRKVLAVAMTDTGFPGRASTGGEVSDFQKPSGFPGR